MITTLPLHIGVIHFVGIGGIGMSGIAEVLHSLGYPVQGSDIAENANVKRLRDMGIHVALEQKAENLGEASVVVISSAVKPDNPEVAAARERLIPVVRRAEMLGELMRLKWSIAVAGTHGKTTTTSLIASLLDAADLDPTVVNGGIINAYGTNARHGDGDWMVVEADESDGSFLKLPATIAVVTNIDPEHMEHYGTFAALRDAFETFASNIPFYGAAILCIDHPEVQAMIPDLRDRKILTYGMSRQADVRGLNVRYEPTGATFDICIRNRRGEVVAEYDDIRLPMLGQHNVQNALAAAAVARQMRLDESALRKALGDFAGVKRRFTKTGEVGGVTVIDDYAHHPIEIAAVLHAARSAGKGQVIAVVQPHRYTRLHALFEEFCTCFNDADHVVVADVYAAGEDPIKGADKDHLVEGLRAHGHRHVLPLESEAALAETIASLARPEDFVICVGAGSISQWANALPEQLEPLLEGAG